MAATQRFGLQGLLLPLALGVGLVLLRFPATAVSLAVGVNLLVERDGDGLLPGGAFLYREGPGRLTPLDWLLVAAIAAVAIDALRRRRTPNLPPLLALSSALIVLAILSGAVVGHAAGVGPLDIAAAVRPALTLLVVPLAVLALGLDRRRIVLALFGLGALAALKAVLGLIAVAAGAGTVVEGSTLTYYEPAANWLILGALLVIAALVLSGARPPLATLPIAALLVASLVLSYRRSFWVGAMLALAVLAVLATSAGGRRLLVPTAALLAAAVWVLSSIGMGDAARPLVDRAQSLAPSRIEQNAEDRYRLDERANVLAELERRPITGLGVDVPWRAIARGLPVEHQDGRRYVHMAPLYWWLKLGLLGVIAYAATMLAALTLAWRVWRTAERPVLRAFGIASLAGVVALLAIETTASFTGVDGRFTMLFAAQLGLLAAIVTGTPEGPPAARERPLVSAVPAARR